MIYGIILKVLIQHALYHLVIPLVVGIGFEVLASKVWESLLNWGQPTPSARLGFLVAGIAITYFVITSILLYKETSVEYKMLKLNTLKETLKDAEIYFAVSTIHLGGWFNPYVQSYLANIVNRRLEDENFLHERVLLFFTKSDLRRAKELPDRYYAQALTDIHINYKIPLAFLERKDILEILRSLKHEELQTIGCYPKWAFKVTDANKDKWLGRRRRFPELDFAFIEKKNDVKCVLPFKKKGDDVEIEVKSNTEKENEELVAVYEILVAKIREKIHPVEGLDVKHDFTKHFYPYP